MNARLAERILSFALIGLLLLPLQAGAQFTLAFWGSHQKPDIVVTTAPQTKYRKVCSSPVTIQTQRGGVQTPTAVPITLNLSASNTTFYSDANCTTPVTSVTISGGESEAWFFFVSTEAPGTLTISLSNTDYSLSQNETLVANPYIWTGGGGDSAWSTAANWSGNAVPGSGDAAIFDSSCVSNCSPTTTANTSVFSVRIESGYSGTITQGTGFTFDHHGWVQYAGTFNGSNAQISVAGSIYVLGGTFQSTSGTLEQWNEGGGAILKVSGGTFNANNGLVLADGYDWVDIDAAGVTFKNLRFETNNTSTIHSNITVSGTLTLASGSLAGSGRIDALGNVVLLNNGVWGDAPEIRIAGSTNQSVDASGATSSTASLPSLKIQSTGGTVSFLGTVLVNGNLAYQSGTVSWGTSTLKLRPIGSNSRYTLTPGSLTYGNVYVETNGAWFDMTGTFTIGGTLTLDCIYSSPSGIDGGVVEARGNVVIKDYGAPGSTELKIAGSSSQSIDASTATQANLPNVRIASTGGTVSLAGTFVVTNNWTYQSGTVNAGTSKISLESYWHDSSYTFGPVTYYDVEFHNAWSHLWILDSLDTSHSIYIDLWGFDVNMPNPGSGYHISTTGNFTVNAGDLNLNGASYSYGSLTNNGNINP